VRNGDVFKGAAIGPTTFTKSGMAIVPVLAKSDSDIVDLNLSAFDAIATFMPSLLEPSAVDASLQTIKQLGLFDRANLVDQVSDRAVAYAQERGAELVGKRRLADGRIVDNPNAEWRIDEDTRDQVRSIIDKGLADNIGRDEIAQQIEDSFWFSEARALLIANTEIAMANSQSTLNSMRDAQKAGVKLGKSWLADPEACDICQANEDAGIIGIDENFPSGDDATPAHPNCECATVPEVIEEAPDEDIERSQSSETQESD